MIAIGRLRFATKRWNSLSLKICSTIGMTMRILSFLNSNLTSFGMIQSCSMPKNRNTTGLTMLTETSSSNLSWSLFERMSNLSWTNWTNYCSNYCSNMNCLTNWTTMRMKLAGLMDNKLPIFPILET